MLKKNIFTSVTAVLDNMSKKNEQIFGSTCVTFALMQSGIFLRHVMESRHVTVLVGCLALLQDPQTTNAFASFQHLGANIPAVKSSIL